jgi:hypothetical protein
MHGRCPELIMLRLEIGSGDIYRHVMRRWG